MLPEDARLEPFQFSQQQQQQKQQQQPEEENIEEATEGIAPEGTADVWCVTENRKIKNILIGDFALFIK